MTAADLGPQGRQSAVIQPRWYTTRQVALMLGYSLTKTKHLVVTGQIQSVKDGGNRRILPEWVDDYIRRRAHDARAEGMTDA